MVKKRFIAFIGNLPFDLTENDLKEFFSPIEDIQIRMRHNKEGKFRGFAFAECTNNDQFQKLLRMHHLELKGRKVNIEMSAGGGGKSEARKQKIKKVNEKITKFRKTIFKGSSEHKKKKEAAEDSNE
ncbi:unnamed protein product [Blepharisma stoltei]|uniref:RRM domain-containing protein n=1 Tax=Blepharisma stoltei TaxID=1481888 RepID=A0AAU9IYH9_9CILI|nr:unnamed protein product [Blepharisma stoltei]